VLQCVAVRCSVLQCVAVRCSVLQRSVLQCVAVRCSVLQWRERRVSRTRDIEPLLQRVAACCSVLQCVAVAGKKSVSDT